jgi:hypothetical protein
LIIQLVRRGTPPEALKRRKNMTARPTNIRPKLYLDIDGVFLLPTVSENYDCRWTLAGDAEEFLDWALDVFDCYWLTARDMRGDRAEIERAFRESLQSLSLPPFLTKALKHIEPTRWSRTKLTGIDLESNFYWIDDAPDQEAVAEIRKRNILPRLVTVEVGPPSHELRNARREIIRNRNAEASLANLIELISKEVELIKKERAEQSSEDKFSLSAGLRRMEEEGRGDTKYANDLRRDIELSIMRKAVVRVRKRAVSATKWPINDPSKKKRTTYLIK